MERRVTDLSSDDPAYWQRQADRAARLADSIHVQDVACTLRALASEYLERAAALMVAPVIEP